ncbi:MAG: multiheme c-type cytochrome [Candidatus Hodarchaeota archaeon]
MNDQEEKLVRKSRWSPSRVVLLYWVAVVFVGTATAAGLGATVLNSKFSFDAADAVHPTFAEPWHPENCTGCHDDIVDTWNQTWHSQYVGSKLVVDPVTGKVTRYYNRIIPFPPPGSGKAEWDNISAFYAEGGCCMVTNWENTTEAGDTVPSGTAWDLGITCAACHETPGVVDPAAEVCESCHGPGGGQYAAWNQSAHSQSLDNLLASDHAKDSCLHCMAGQATYMDVSGMAVNDTSLTNIVCVTCHDPHDASINAEMPSDNKSPWTNPYTGVTYGPGGHQLRTATTNELCGKCHTDAYELQTNTIYTSQHISLDCADCHGYAWIPPTYFANGSIDDAGSFPSTLNHSWTFTAPDSCDRCHVGENATQWAKIQDMDYVDLMETYETQLENVTAKAGEAENKSGVSEAKVDNVNALIDEAEDLADAAKLGFHNPDLAAEKAKLALAKLDEAYAAAEDAIDTAAPGFEWTGVLLVLSILGIATVLFRKKRR